MKIKEREKAIQLRKQGWSLRKIQEELNVSKASVSNWVRGVSLTKKQMEFLKGSPYTSRAVELRRQSRMSRVNDKRKMKINSAAKELGSLSLHELLFLGIGLYWGEGTKRKLGSVELTNSDPEMLRIGMLFFRKVCKVAEHKFRAHIYLHEDQSKDRAIQFWSKQLNLQREFFQKTTILRNRNRSKTNASLRYGTCAIAIYDTKLHLQIIGWIQGVVEEFSKKTVDHS